MANGLIIVLQGNYTVATIDGKSVFNKQIPVRNQNGFAAIGTDNLGLADFDNFVLAT